LKSYIQGRSFQFFYFETLIANYPAETFLLVDTGYSAEIGVIKIILVIA
jgi:hypothetical protein